MSTETVKIHFLPDGASTACGIGWTKYLKANSDARLTTCLRCAASVTWREDMGMPKTASGRHGVALCKNGPTLRLEFQTTDSGGRGWWKVFSGRQLLRRFVGFKQARDAALISSEAWARAHGFRNVEFAP
jgi:hypothetical protein